MPITSVAEELRYMKNLKSGFLKAVRTGLQGALEQGQTDLQATAPVDTGEYRDKIELDDAKLGRGIVSGAIPFEAPHSVFVIEFGYHTALLGILTRITRDATDRIRNEVRAAVRGVRA